MQIFFTPTLFEKVSDIFIARVLKDVECLDVILSREFFFPLSYLLLTVSIQIC